MSSPAGYCGASGLSVLVCSVRPVLRNGDNEEFRIAQGAFRSGKYKYMGNVWCSGWYTYDKATQAADPLTNTSVVCDGSPCSDCGRGECDDSDAADWLFDLEADPREETNLVDVYPDVSQS